MTEWWNSGFNYAATTTEKTSEIKPAEE